jgi:hypothetical protein
MIMVLLEWPLYSFFRDKVKWMERALELEDVGRWKKHLSEKNVGTFMGKPYIYLSVVNVAMEHQTDQ